MNGRGTVFTLVFLAATVVVILGALFWQTSRQPTFRAADYASMDECIRNIPTEWQRGSLEYDGAETACYFVHREDRPTPP